MVIRELLRGISERLSDIGIDNARFEAECLLQKAGLARLTLLTEPNMPVSEEVGFAARELTRRRLNGEPLQYIIGEWEFYGCSFAVGEGVLIPRQDTETLTELAEGFLLKRRADERTVADLCAGSGCIGIALARRCGCRVSSFELSERAMEYLKRNIELNGVSELVRPIRADVLETAAAEQFDAIVTNPPYLTAADMTELQREVSFEPQMALYGGCDGLDFYRGIMRLWTGSLKSGGLIAAEIGMGQETDVMRIFSENGIQPECGKDACGIYRVVYGIKQ